MNIDHILDDLSVRFILTLPKSDLEYSERLYFALEESYWFFLDFYFRRDRSIQLSFRAFCERILIHNSLKFKESDYRAFKTYKRKVPVYGGIILNKQLDHVLLVKGMRNSHYFFPKGKKCMDEDGIQCCRREVLEEVGVDISSKISKLFLETKKGIFYFVFYVSMNQKLRTSTRFEISSVKWVSIDEIENSKSNTPYSAVKMYIEQIKIVIQNIKKSQFKFDIKKILKKVEEKLLKT